MQLRQLTLHLAIFIILSLFLFYPQSISAQSGQPLLQFPDVEAIIGEDGRFLSPAIEVDKSEHIGLTIESAFSNFSPPKQIFSLRGEEDWQDDVVFYYSDNSYFYWFENRVWQIRYDTRYTGTVAGLRMGETRAKVIETLGQAHFAGPTDIFYNIHNSGYPMRMRLVFEKNLLNDIYIYRSDF